VIQAPDSREPEKWYHLGVQFWNPCLLSSFGWRYSPGRGLRCLPWSASRARRVVGGFRGDRSPALAGWAILRRAAHLISSRALRAIWRIMYASGCIVISPWLAFSRMDFRACSAYPSFQSVVCSMSQGYRDFSSRTIDQKYRFCDRMIL